MKTYHIVYYESSEDYYSRGVNIEADNEVEALIKWRQENPGKIFWAMFCKD
jgi:hypothetical protein